jgi:TPR repeat protein
MNWGRTLKKALKSRDIATAFTTWTKLEVVQSFTEGIKYLTKSAELGSNVAQNSLGVINAEGRVSPKNLAEAYKWFVIASANGYENAQSNKGNAEKQLTPNEVKSIQIKAKQWQDKYLKSND